MFKEVQNNQETEWIQCDGNLGTGTFQGGGNYLQCQMQREVQEFPGGTVDKTSHSQFREPGFNPWSGN